MSRRRRWAVGIAGLLLVVAGGVFADWWHCLPPDVSAGYVGGATCMECHAGQARLWQGSHHDLAMDLATTDSVLGDFDDATFEHFGIESRMFRRGDEFYVVTEGPDGELGEFRVKYVLGVEPLQQYMVEFDRAAGAGDEEIGRLQVLRLSWDTENGRWFYLPPPDVRDEKLAPDDELHWTGSAQRWNTMCADCHSTDLQRNFDTDTLRYSTTYSDIDVSCEACHGPGSVHVELARSRSLFWDRRHGYGLEVELKNASAQVEVETCAPCHSRRRVIHADARPGEPYDDYYGLELITPETYFADGQIQDEVYVHGSFLQSRMYHQGIRCTDCHDPHTARLKHNGNQVCVSCHQHTAGEYDSIGHHFHPMGTLGASCVECHMPETTYMEVDPRRDHSLRVPRPDLSVEFGVPNACTGCHLDRAPLAESRRADFLQYRDWVLAARDGDEEVREALAEVDRWAADAVARWYPREEGDERPLHYGALLARAFRGEEDADAALRELVLRPEEPGVVRASALALRDRLPGTDDLEVEALLMEDDDPLVRAAAVGRAGNVLETSLPPPGQTPGRQQLMQLVTAAAPIVGMVSDRLDDPSRLVRTEAARVLGQMPPSILVQLISGEQQEQLQRGLDEWRAGLMVTNDRAGAHMALGILYERQQRFAEARRAYETAVRVEPQATGPRSNLAALLEREVTRLEQQAVQASTARARQAAREQQQSLRERVAQLRLEELDRLARDARLAPENAAIQYRYGLLLYLHDRFEEAEEALRLATELDPANDQYLHALALFYQRFDRLDEAREAAARLLLMRPEMPVYQELYRSLSPQDRVPLDASVLPGPAGPGPPD